ncbi:MAG: hypothetical protein LUE61_07155 [Clostridiales bacterium]|nr:hypothetical protein [Clostridiales bacterium]
MTDTRVTKARAELTEALCSIQSSIKSDGNAEYYLTVLPPRLRELEEAVNNLAVTEATVQAEVLERLR